MPELTPTPLLAKAVDVGEFVESVPFVPSLTMKTSTGGKGDAGSDAPRVGASSAEFIAQSSTAMSASESQQGYDAHGFEESALANSPRAEQTDQSSLPGEDTLLASALTTKAANDIDVGNCTESCSSSPSSAMHTDIG